MVIHCKKVETIYHFPTGPEHLYCHIVRRLWGGDCFSNSDDRRMFLVPRIQPLELALIPNRLRLGHVLHMPTERLPCSMLFFEEGISWEMSDQ